MKLGRVLTYKDIDEAKRLLGKKVVASDGLRDLEILASTIHPGLLEAIDEGPVACPFQVSGHYSYQFIREVLPDKPTQPRYEPYDLSDPKVRKSLRGKWIIWNDGDEDDADEAVVIGFVKREGDPWEVKTSIGGIDAAELLKFYVFDDGTPCGQLVHAGEGHVEGNASERRIDG